MKMTTITSEKTNINAPHTVSQTDVSSTQRTEEAHTSGPHISIKPETIFHVSGFPVTNSLLLSLVVFVFFIVGALKYSSDAKKRKKSKYFYAITFAMRSIYDLFQSALEHKVGVFFSLVGAFFFFILLQNWSGLLPGVGSILIGKAPLFRANTADLNTTVALALIAVSLVQFYGIKYNGVKGYLGKFLDFSSPIAFFVGILEVVSELSRILSFAFRLFGNIFAGEVLLTVVAFLVPVLVSFPFLMLEVFVGLIQAVVFSMLAAVLLNLATSKHH